MNQFGTILKFELLSYLKNKTFLGITIFLVVVIAAVMFFPRVSGIFIGGKDKDSSGQEIVVQDEESPVMAILAKDPVQTKLVYDAFSASFPDYRILLPTDGLSDVKEQIISGEIECAFVMENLTSYTYYVNNLNMYDGNTAIADETLQNLCRIDALSQAGISQETAAEILSLQINHETENLGVDQAQNYFYTYIMIMVLYMAILLYGQMVATNYATEKSSRAMELLITSAKPASMMFGKVIASCLAGIIQLVAVFGSAYLFYNINKSMWGNNPIITSLFDMPLYLLVYMLIFFVLGFFVYAFLYGAIGSTASKVEDINTSVMPLTFLFIAAFFAVIFSMSSGNVDNMVMKVCSYIPFTSPMAMFTRIAMSTVPFYEVAISIVILILSVFGIGIISAKIYRVGVLLYGTTPKFRAIIKAVRKA